MTTGLSTNEPNKERERIDVFLKERRREKLAFQNNDKLYRL